MYKHTTINKKPLKKALIKPFFSGFLYKKMKRGAMVYVMNEATFIGYFVTAVITLGGFIAVINKMTQPINDLRVVVQELKDCIQALKDDNISQGQRITKHGEQIDNLNNRVGKIETKIKIYEK